MPQVNKKPQPAAAPKRDNIAPQLLPLAVPIKRLVPDPNNARLHGERNMAAIRASLERYGQVKPVVVRKQGMVVVAGNGTLAAAKALGWTRLAANVMPMTDAEAAGYGLADNRTAELAEWDAEVVGRLEALLREAGEAAVGWTDEELASLRASVPTAPQDFPEVGEDIETEHRCPKCGYRWSGGEVKAGDDAEEG